MFYSVTLTVIHAPTKPQPASFPTRNIFHTCQVIFPLPTAVYPNPEPVYRLQSIVNSFLKNCSQYFDMYMTERSNRQRQ